jgi:hypothetical protein
VKRSNSAAAMRLFDELNPFFYHIVGAMHLFYNQAASRQKYGKKQ